jgi:hypothetical protein
VSPAIEQRNLGENEVCWTSFWQSHNEMVKSPFYPYLFTFYYFLLIFYIIFIAFLIKPNTLIDFVSMIFADIATSKFKQGATGVFSFCCMYNYFFRVFVEKTSSSVFVRFRA